MLEWTQENYDSGVVIHEGKMNGELYALIAVDIDGTAYSQFKGLEGGDLYSDSGRVSPNFETAKKICEVMMSAWRHKAN